MQNFNLCRFNVELTEQISFFLIKKNPVLFVLKIYHSRVSLTQLSALLLRPALFQTPLLSTTVTTTTIKVKGMKVKISWNILGNLKKKNQNTLFACRLSKGCIGNILETATTITTVTAANARTTTTSSATLTTTTNTTAATNAQDIKAKMLWNVKAGLNKTYYSHTGFRKDVSAMPQERIEGVLKKGQGRTATNTIISTTTVATTEAKGIKVKLSGNIQGNVELNQNSQ